jgi:hypothetical protein
MSFHASTASSSAADALEPVVSHVSADVVVDA